MANDRFFCRCKICGDYLCLGKMYPGMGVAISADLLAFGTFIESHLSHCQRQGISFEGAICLVFDSEETFCAAGGTIGGSGNIDLDQAERTVPLHKNRGLL